jgi:hypothetical protein
MNTRAGTADNAPSGEGLCECGCGQLAPIAKVTRTERGQVKGQPVRFISGHNARGMDRSGPRKVQHLPEDRGYDTPCWIWQRTKTKPNPKGGAGGYGKTRYKGKEYLAHRLYYQEAKGPIPKGMQIDHLCKQRDCVNPDHLEAVTPMENTRRSGSAKLTMEQASEVWQLACAGVPQILIADWYGISVGTVKLIKKNGPDGPRLPGR